MEDYNNMNLSFRPFDASSELQGQRTLFIECFPENQGESAATEDHYKWKFKTLLNGKAALEYGAYLDNELIGYYAAIPYRYRIEGQWRTAGMVCDVMTGIKSRGKGVFTKLGVYATGQMAESGISFVTGYPIRPEVIPGHLKAGWQIMFELPMYARFLRLNKYLAAKKLGWLTPLANSVLFLLNSTLALAALGPSKKAIVRHFDSKHISDIPGWKNLMDGWHAQVPHCLEKSNEFMRWRLAAPHTQYTISVIYENEIAVGFAISTPTRKEGLDSLGLIDFFVNDQHIGLSNALMRAVSELGNAQNRDILIMMLQPNIYRKYKLLYNGFLKTPFKFKLITKVFDPAINRAQLENMDNWHLMWIDSDDL
jgi:hypothetical protein